MWSPPSPGPLILIVSVLSYYYVTLSRVIEMRLHGEVERSWPRIYARPLELRAGQSLTAEGLIERLNDLGYAGRPQVTEAGQFAVGAERHRAVDSRRKAGRHGDPGRVRSGRGQAGHPGDRDDPPHRARRRRHARSAAPRSSRRS